MTADLLLQLEKKVEHAIEVIELLRLQVEELETENDALKAEHSKWRNDLTALIRRFDRIDSNIASAHKLDKTYSTANEPQEEDFMTI